MACHGLQQYSHRDVAQIQAVCAKNEVGMASTRLNAALCILSPLLRLRHRANRSHECTPHQGAEHDPWQ